MFDGKFHKTATVLLGGASNQYKYTLFKNIKTIFGDKK